MYLDHSNPSDRSSDPIYSLRSCVSSIRLRGHPDMMSASEGEAGNGKADIVRDVA